jgi:hypothetical protein
MAANHLLEIQQRVLDLPLLEADKFQINAKHQTTKYFGNDV